VPSSARWPEESTGEALNRRRHRRFSAINRGPPPPDSPPSGNPRPCRPCRHPRGEPPPLLPCPPSLQRPAPPPVGRPAPRAVHASGHGRGCPERIDVAWAFLADVVAEVASGPSVSHCG
jgi:hypothetical protein